MDARAKIEFLKHQHYKTDTTPEASQERAKYLNELLSLSPLDQRAVLESKDKDELSAMSLSLQKRLQKNLNDKELELIATVQLFRMIGLVASSHINSLVSMSQSSALPVMLEQIKSWQKENYKPPLLGINSVSLNKIQDIIEAYLSQKSVKSLPSLLELKEDLDFARQTFEEFKKQYKENTPQYNYIQNILAILTGKISTQQKINELLGLVSKANRLDSKNLGDIATKIQANLLDPLKKIAAIENRPSVFERKPAPADSTQRANISKKPS